MQSKLAGTVLVVEDDPIDAEILLRGIGKIPRSELSTHWVTSLREARRAIVEIRPEVVLVDLTLPDSRQLDVVRALAPLCDDVVLIVQTGLDDERLTIRALELGAQDFLHKGTITPELLGRSIRYALARLRTNRELAVAQRERDQSDDDLDGFAHVVAHDLRAPVRTARLFADRLRHEAKSSNPLVEEYGERLEQSLETVERLIFSMLDYACLRQVPDGIDIVDAADCPDQGRQLISGDLDEARGSIFVDIARPLFTVADSEQLTRVIVNLLANSVKYRRDDRAPAIELTGRMLDDKIVIDVIDNGIGVDPGDAERAFTLLERLDPRRASGLGFGLPIARRIVESYGGTIGFLHDQPAGAHLQVVLPAVVARTAALTAG